MTTKPTGDPILIRCEGSGCPPCRTSPGNGTEAYGICAMCGHWYALNSYVVGEHTRDDLIARIKRGDFG
jgi:hypothetical protein